MSDASELLAAGAVLPLGTEDAGEQAVLLTARTYRHPVMDDRLVVRLTDADLGQGEDQASGYLGLERIGEPVEVGFGRRTVLGFPEWVLAHHPADGHHALAVIPEMQKIGERAKTKPKAALDAFHELAGRLASSVPHLLPTYYERAARTFLTIENAAYAAQMFTHARKAEAEHGLPIDDERHDAVFLEFALAGVLPVKALSGYAKELASRVSAEEALRRFKRLCVRRTASGLPPSAQMAVELRRLARSAGENVESAEHAYLTELLALPAVVRAAAGWWKAHRAALASLAGQRPEVRGALLDMMPVSDDDDFPRLWLEILEEAGATEALHALDGVPEEARPQDGGAGWLKRYLGFLRSGWRRLLPSALLPLVERMADRIRAELTARGEGFEIPAHVDLLDLLLALDVPVADPGEDHELSLGDWARHEERRDLLALEADRRFRQAFRRGADSFGADEDAWNAMRALAASPGGRPLLVEWVGEVVRRLTAAGLPGLPDALRRIGRLPGEVLALNEEAVRAAVTSGLESVLARALRTGVFDELGWPAWEEALAALAPADELVEVFVAEAWPYLIVAGPAQARVIGFEGTVLVHDLRIPAGDSPKGLGFHYVDGELLVHWRSAQHGGKKVGYWHTEADRLRPMEGHLFEAKSMYWYQQSQDVSLALSSGGRATGVGWHEYDPVNDERGRESLPAFFADGVRDMPGSSFVSGWLLPAPSTGATPAGTVVDGTALLPPVRYWNCLSPRDPRGSAVLRGIGHETASSLIKAAEADGDLSEAVRALLPDITHEALIAGVAGVVRYTVEQKKVLDGAAERLERTLAETAGEEAPGPSDGLLKSALNGLGHRWDRSRRDDSPRFFGRIRVLAEAMEAGPAADPEPRPRIHLDGPELPGSDLQLDELLEIRDSMLYRVVAGFSGPEDREALRELLAAFEGLGLGAELSARWRRFELGLDEAELKEADGTWRQGSWKGLLPLGGGAFLLVLDDGLRNSARVFAALFHDPAGLFEVPAPYTVGSSGPVVPYDALPQAAFLAEAAERGPAPWFPEAAEEFSRLTGVTGTMAKLVIAGLPAVDSDEHDFLTPELRALLEVKVAEAAFARDRLRWLKVAIRRKLLAALLPADPARLWTGGPDTAAAAEVWNAEFGRRVAVPEALLAEAAKAVRTGWDADYALPVLLDPDSEPRLSRDLKWVVRGDGVVPEDTDAVGFDSTVLRSSVALTAWLAHRLPAGDPMRERLPAALAVVRERLANPDLMLVAGDHVDLPVFRKAAGAPTETGPGFERYGAVVMTTHDDLPYPAIRTALLDETGDDPYLALLSTELPELAAMQRSWRTALDERFAALLADPGDPAAGERGADGTWWPQDPSRSVPDLVAEAGERHGLGADAAAVYLMLLAMPDPTDRNTARWTGWKPARLKAARAELAATGLVLEASRSRAGRSLFLPGGWAALRTPYPPQEEWRLPLYDLAADAGPEASHGVIVPFEPVADLYRRAWRRIVDGDVPRFADLEVRRGRR